MDVADHTNIHTLSVPFSELQLALASLQNLSLVGTSNRYPRGLDCAGCLWYASASGAYFALGGFGKQAVLASADSSEADRFR